MWVCFEGYVGIVMMFFGLFWCKVFWVELFWVFLDGCMMMYCMDGNDDDGVFWYCEFVE